MSAWDDGYAAGKAQRAAGVTELDPVLLRDLAVAYAQIAIGLYRPDAADAEHSAADEWLYGFYKAALEEIADEA